MLVVIPFFSVQIQVVSLSVSPLSPYDSVTHLSLSIHCVFSVHAETIHYMICCLSPKVTEPTCKTSLHRHRLERESLIML